MNNLKSALTIALKFIESPDEFFWASNFTGTLSQASAYRLLELLRELEFITKSRQMYYLNHKILQDKSYIKTTLPYIGRQSKRETMLYLLRYLLCDYHALHSISEVQILFNRNRKDITAILKLLKEYKVITEIATQVKNKKKPVRLYKLNPELTARLTARANIIQMHKNKLEVRQWQ